MFYLQEITVESHHKASLAYLPSAIAFNSLLLALETVSQKFN